MVSRSSWMAACVAGLVWVGAGAGAALALEISDVLKGLEGGAAQAIAQAARPQLDRVLEREVRALVAHADRMVDAIALKATADERQGLRDASRKMFGRTRVEKVAIRGLKASGAVEHVDVRLRDLEVHGVLLDLVEVELDDIAIDATELIAHGRVKLAQDLKARLRVRVAAEAVNRVTGRYTVSFSPGEVGVATHVGNSYCHALITAHAGLESTAENALVIRPTSVTCGFLPLPEFAYDATVARRNPVYDLKQSLGIARSGVDLRLGKVAIGDGTVEIAVEGTIHANVPTAMAAR